jgi:hypothetical protein
VVQGHSRVGPHVPVVCAHVLHAQVARGAHAHPLLAIQDRAFGAPQVRATKGGERKEDEGGEWLWREMRSAAHHEPQ